MFSIVNPPSRSATLAMAGIVQASLLVRQLAREDRYDRASLRMLAVTLLKIDSRSVDEIYGSAGALAPGLRAIVRLFGSKPDAAAREVYQYSVLCHQLALKLLSLERTAQLIQDELGGLVPLPATGEMADGENIQEVYEAISDLYSRTISFISPRIIVQETSGRLQDPQTIARVRTGLFAAIRSAVLWHQSGGRRWQLLFNRGMYAERARRCLNED